MIFFHLACPHADDQLQLVVDNRGSATKAGVYCVGCTSLWTADTLPTAVLDRCLELFEGMRQ